MSGFSFQIFLESEKHPFNEFFVPKCWYDTSLVIKFSFQASSSSIEVNLKFENILKVINFGRI